MKAELRYRQNFLRFQYRRGWRPRQYGGRQDFVSIRMMRQMSGLWDRVGPTPRPEAGAEDVSAPNLKNATTRVSDADDA